MFLGVYRGIVSSIYYPAGLRNSSVTFAMLAAIRCASFLLAAPRAVRSCHLSPDSN
jgi:hypothetical protein